MPLVEVVPNKFINTDHVMTVAYKPAEIHTEEVVDGTDYNLPKKVKSKGKSSIKVTLSSGDTIEFKGEEADSIFTILSGKQLAPKKDQ